MEMQGAGLSACVSGEAYETPAAAREDGRLMSCSSVFPLGTKR